MTSRRARTGFGLLAGVALAVSAGALGMAAVAADAPPGSSGAGAAPGGSPSFTVAPTPCSPRGDGACTAAPAKVGVTFPSGTSTVSGVAVAWTTTGRPAGTGPAHTATFLKLADGGCPSSSSATTCTWSWPADLEAPGSSVVLNGSYVVQSCTGTSAAPICPSSAGAPNNLLIAAPPAPPAAARASGAATAVTVTWSPGPEPDLVGYAVTRNNVAVFTCSVHGATLPGSAPCSSQLGYTDRPGSGGAFTYGIVAKRFGLDSNPANYLSSQQAVASINVGSSSIGALPPIPLIGTPNVVLPGAPSGTSAGAAGGVGSASAPTTTLDPGSGGLEYGQGHPNALGPVEGAQSGTSTSVSRLALIAAGLLVLALAAHLLYLRGAVARYQMAHGGHARGRGAHLRRRPPMRIQWGQWPPLIRDGGDLSSPG